jgi:hypothetical protein
VGKRRTITKGTVLNQKEKLTVAEAIARQLISGQMADRELTESLIKALCEEYHEVRQRGIFGDGQGPVGEM